MAKAAITSTSKFSCSTNIEDHKCSACATLQCELSDTAKIYYLHRSPHH